MRYLVQVKGQTLPNMIDVEQWTVPLTYEFTGENARRESAKKYADLIREIFLKILLEDTIEGLEIISTDPNESFHAVTTFISTDSSSDFHYGSIELLGPMDMFDQK